MNKEERDLLLLLGRIVIDLDSDGRAARDDILSLRTMRSDIEFNYAKAQAPDDHEDARIARDALYAILTMCSESSRFGPLVMNKLHLYDKTLHDDVVQWWIRHRAAGPTPAMRHDACATAAFLDRLRP